MIFKEFNLRLSLREVTQGDFEDKNRFSKKYVTYLHGRTDSLLKHGIKTQEDIISSFLSGTRHFLVIDESEIVGIIIVMVGDDLPLSSPELCYDFIDKNRLQLFLVTVLQFFCKEYFQDTQGDILWFLLKEDDFSENNFEKEIAMIKKVGFLESDFQPLGLHVHYFFLLNETPRL